jgi:hypothetical protein
VLPEAGVHTTGAGGRPPGTLTWYWTGTPAGSAACPSTCGGHVRLNGPGLGPVDEPPQAAAAIASGRIARATRQRRRRLVLQGRRADDASNEATMWLLP